MDQKSENSVWELKPLETKTEKTEQPPQNKLSKLSLAYWSQQSLHKLFWIYLVGGSVVWLTVFYVVGLLLTGGKNPNEDIAGFVLLIIAVLIYLWGFVFSAICLICAWKVKGNPAVKYGYMAGLFIYLLTLFSGLAVFVHVSMML